MNTIKATFFYDGGSKYTPTTVKKELSTDIIFQTITESIRSQYAYIFGEIPHHLLLEQLVNGFVLFNLHKNKYMLNSKDELLKYVKDNNISIEENVYFTDIFLYNQRPKFLTADEHECIRACGSLNK
jgi:hypothetical protein